MSKYTTASPRHLPGEKLTEMLWLMALKRGERLPKPTMDRLNTLKLMVAKWEDEDNDEA